MWSAHPPLAPRTAALYLAWRLSVTSRLPEEHLTLFSQGLSLLLPVTYAFCRSNLCWIGTSSRCSIRKVNLTTQVLISSMSSNVRFTLIAFFSVPEAHSLVFHPLWLSYSKNPIPYPPNSQIKIITWLTNLDTNLSNTQGPCPKTSRSGPGRSEAFHVPRGSAGRRRSRHGRPGNGMECHES